MLCKNTPLFHEHNNAPSISDQTVKRWVEQGLRQFERAGVEDFYTISGDTLIHMLIHKESYEEDPRITIRRCKIQEVCWMERTSVIKAWLEQE